MCHIVSDHWAGLLFGSQLALPWYILLNHKGICELVILANLHIFINWNQRLLILQVNVIILEKLLNIWYMIVNSGWQALTVKYRQLMVYRNLIIL